MCREEGKSIILHHIQPWERSRSHAESNLAVLCLEHHDKAHSVGTLSKNLTADEIAAAKASWESEVRRFDAAAIVSAMRLADTDWLYFNHARIFRLAEQLNVSLSNCSTFGVLRSRNLVDDRGYLMDRVQTLPHMYADSSGQQVYLYVREVLTSILQKITVFNISDLLDGGALKAMFAAGDFVFVQGAHVFRREPDSRRASSGQLVRVSRSANRVDVLFVIDLWEATSTSAWSVWLTGKQQVGSLLRVRDVARGPDGHLAVSCTAYAIAHGTDALLTRDYAAKLWPLVYSKEIDED